MAEYKPDKIEMWESVDISSVHYWLTEEQLIPWLHFPIETYATVATTWDYNDLINKPTIPTANTPKLQQFTFNATWNIAVTWVWFTPKLVEFHFTDQSWAYWVWKMTSTYQFAFDVGYSWTQIQTECIYIRNSLWNAIWRAVYVSMDSDWFTINVTFSTWVTIYVNYTCF